MAVRFGSITRWSSFTDRNISSYPFVLQAVTSMAMVRLKALSKVKAIISALIGARTPDILVYSITPQTYATQRAPQKKKGNSSNRNVGLLGQSHQI
jgi:hypothetical protein